MHNKIECFGIKVGVMYIRKCIVAFKARAG